MTNCIECNQPKTCTPVICRECHEKMKKELSAVTRERDAAVELIWKLERCLNVLDAATEYIKPNTGVWHTTGIALDAIKHWHDTQEAGEDTNENLR